MKWLLYWHTLKFLKPVQIVSRVEFVVKKNLLKRAIGRMIQKQSLQKFPQALHLKKRCYSRDALQDLSTGRFKFLNIESDYKEEIDWSDASKSKLWLYNLHYFEYLLPLTRDVNEKNFSLAKKVLEDWLQNNPIGHGNGWEPYPISLRVVNWIFFYDAYYDFFQKEKYFKEEFLNSLYRQVAYLNYFLEKHLLANHLWANVKTLLFAGLFFKQQKWIRQGLKLVQRELHEQILADGGHYERSPLYHALILLDLIDLLNLIKALEKSGNDLPVDVLKVREEVMVKSKLMWQWLVEVTQPDGGLPLIGDTAQRIAPTTKQIGQYLESVVKEPENLKTGGQIFSLPQSGYFVYRDAQRYLIIDGGELGVSYQPGHAHCDFLSYELSVKGKRLIVDSGAGEYLPTELRHKARSIYSHNTVVVNGLDQAELWSAFRMGRRIHPDKVWCKRGPVFEFQGSYYNNLNSKLAYWHQRMIRVDKTVEVIDHFKVKKLLSIENLIHVHPECSIKIEENRVLLERENVGISINFDGEQIRVSLRDWFYVPEFGKVLPAKVIALAPVNQTSHKMSYELLFV